MIDAARTTASPAATWAIVIVAVVALATWLTAIMLADRYQVKTSGRWRMTGDTEAASGEAEAATGGGWAGGSLPGADAPEIPGEAFHEPIGVGGRYVGHGSAPEGDIPTRIDLPAQSRGPDAMPAEPAWPQAQPTERPTMPTQRSGDADRAERSYAGPPPDEDESDGSGTRP